MGLLELEEALSIVTRYIPSISSDDYPYQVLFHLLHAQILFAMYQSGLRPLAVTILLFSCNVQAIQDDYSQAIRKAQEIVDARPFTPVIKQALSYLIAVHLSLYYCENSTVKSAKKWIASVNQAVTTSLNNQFPIEIANEVRHLLRSSTGDQRVSCASVIPHSTQEIISPTLLKAKLEYSRGNYAKVLAACEPLRNTSELTRMDVFTLSLMSSAYFALGKKQLARWTLETILSPVFSERDGETTIDFTASSSGASLGSALTILDRNILLSNLGIVYESLGNYKAAIGAFQHLHPGFDKHPIVMTRYAESYWKQYQQDKQTCLLMGK